MSWLLRTLRGLMKFSSTFLSLRLFARGRLKASVKAFRKELASQGLPPKVVEDLVEHYRRLGEDFVRSLLSKGMTAIREAGFLADITRELLR